MTKKTHAPRQPPGESGMTLTLCGRLEPTTSLEPTCEACKRWLDEHGLPPAARAFVATWEPLERGTRYDSRHDAIAFASVPGRIRRPFRWPSIERALREFIITRHDGFASKSVTAGLTRFARLGAQVQGGDKRASRAERQAEDAAAVDLSLQWACSRRIDPDAATQRVIVLARVVGEHRVQKKRTRSGHAVDDWSPVSAERLAAELAVPETEVGVIVREVKRWLRIDMGARGLVPMPHGPRNVLAAEERRRELGARRTA